MTHETPSERPENTAAEQNTETQPNGHENGAAGGIEAKIEQLRQDAQEKENKYRYLYAEFENYKKRVIKERSDLQKFGWEGVARELLQVADNLERALRAAAPGTDKALLDGLEMVLRQFHNTLEKWGVKGIETDKQSFDPNFHEAVAQAPADAPEGQIVAEATRGYTLHGRLLRPARVVISSGAAPKA